MKQTEKTFDGLDASMEELQALWRQREERIDRLAGAPGAQPQAFSAPEARPAPRRMDLADVLLGVAMVGMLVLTGIRHAQFDTDWMTRAVGIVLALCCLAVPVYGLVARRLAVAPLTRPQTTFFGMALVALVAFSSFTTVGDGYTITQNYYGRADAVESVNFCLGLQS